MARIRSIHPGLFTDEAFVSLTPQAQVFWIGLLCDADDQGVFEWKPLSLKMRILPAAPSDVPDLLAELAGQNLIRQFEHGGQQLGAVRNFCRYQRPKWPRAVFPVNDDIRTFTAADGRSETGPLTFSRDITATARQRRKRANDRDNVGRSHGAKASVSRTMRDNDGTVTPEERRGEESRKNSVPNGTGASAPPMPSASPASPDWRSLLFRDGLAIVIALTGKTEAGTRPMMGRWMKAARDDARQVLRLIEDAREANPADPVAWIEASLRGPRKPATDSMAFVMARN